MGAAAFEVVARDGEAVTDALLADLAGIIVPALERAPDEVREATTAAQRAFQRRLSGGRRRRRRGAGEER